MAKQKRADGASDQRQILQNAIDDAYFQYLGDVADSQLKVALGTEPAENLPADTADALNTQKQTVAPAWVNWSKNVAGLQTQEVSDLGKAETTWQSAEGSGEESAVDGIADAQATLTGSLASAAAGLIGTLATDEGGFEAAVAQAGATLTSGVMAAEQTLTHAEALADQADEMRYVKAEVADEDAVVGQWAQPIENNSPLPSDPQAGAPGQGEGGSPLTAEQSLSQYDAQVAAAEQQQTIDDGAALIAEAQGVTGADVTQSDEEETAVVNLVDGVSQAAADETSTTAPEEAAAIGAAAEDTAGAGGESPPRCGWPTIRPMLGPPIITPCKHKRPTNKRRTKRPTSRALTPSAAPRKAKPPESAPRKSRWPTTIERGRAKLELVKELHAREMRSGPICQLYRLIDGMLRLPESQAERAWQELCDFEREIGRQFITDPEDPGRKAGWAEVRKDYLRQIETVLLYKCQDPWLALVPAIRQIHDVARLRKIITVLDAKDSLETVRQLVSEH